MRSNSKSDEIINLCPRTCIPSNVGNVVSWFLWVQIPRCPVSRPGPVLDAWSCIRHAFDAIASNVDIISGIVIIIIIYSQNPARSSAWRCRWVECPSLCPHSFSSPPCAPPSRRGRAWSTRRPTSEPRCQTPVAACTRTDMQTRMMFNDGLRRRPANGGREFVVKVGAN